MWSTTTHAFPVPQKGSTPPPTPGRSPTQVLQSVHSVLRGEHTGHVWGLPLPRQLFQLCLSATSSSLPQRRPSLPGCLIPLNAAEPFDHSVARHPRLFTGKRMAGAKRGWAGAWVERVCGGREGCERNRQLFLGGIFQTGPQSENKRAF